MKTAFTAIIFNGVVSYVIISRFVGSLTPWQPLKQVKTSDVATAIRLNTDMHRFLHTLWCRVKQSFVQIKEKISQAFLDHPTVGVASKQLIKQNFDQESSIIYLLVTWPTLAIDQMMIGTSHESWATKQKWSARGESGP